MGAKGRKSDDDRLVGAAALGPKRGCSARTEFTSDFTAMRAWQPLSSPLVVGSSPA